MKPANIKRPFVMRQMPNSAIHKMAALVAHKFRSLTPFKCEKLLKLFIEKFIPHIGFSIKTCTTRTLRKYIDSYDEGQYDAHLLVHWGVARVVWPHNFRSLNQLVREGVVRVLCQLSLPELEAVSIKSIITILNDTQRKLGVRPYTRDRCWAHARKREALLRVRSGGAAVGNVTDLMQMVLRDNDSVHRAVDLPSVESDTGIESDKAESVVISASLVDNFDGDWCGPIPDCKVLHPREETGEDVIFESGQVVAPPNDPIIIVESSWL